MAHYVRNSIFLLLAVIVIVVGYNIHQMEKRPPSLEYSVFLTQLAEGRIKEVQMRGGEIIGLDRENQPFATFSPAPAALLPRLEEQGVAISARPEPAASSFWTTTFPVLLLIGGLMLFMVLQQRGGLARFSKKNLPSPADALQKVSFADVAGIPEAQEELMEIVECLRNPRRITRLGGRIPKGVLLQGPPGTGKTLLAKAIAGEAGVPFYSMSGSDFVEMFVGVGASRVRELFREAKKHAPCIIFIDELDAVGRSRGAAAGAGGQDEREQTLNALLVEMDGFLSDESVVIVAATNRPDVLDPALLRPGRFDRQVTILPPDINGRVKILEVHSRQVTMGPDVDLKEVARNTPGFTGAELANLVNEAALMAARGDKEEIQPADFERARDTILMGAERKGMVINQEERKITAYHEAGHAILAKILPKTDPLHKITIIPRGRAMGVTQQVPIDDRHSYSKEYLMNRIKIMLGGRTAEEIVFREFSTGASNDLQSATNLASRMVCEWGMSQVLGPRAYVKETGGFLHSEAALRPYSEEIARTIDTEINILIETCYQEAMIILEGKIDHLHRLAELLLVKETIGAREVEMIMQGNQFDEPVASPLPPAS